MADLFGFIFILLIFIVTWTVGSKWPAVKKIIIIALCVRILLILIDNYFLDLPDSTKDASGFQDKAWSYGKDGFLIALSRYPGFDSFFYGWVIGVLFSLFGKSILIAQSLGLFFGVATVFLSWYFGKKLWDDNTAIRIGWIVALFPSLVMYSAIPLREVYIGFFLLLAMYGVFSWVRNDDYKSILLAIFGFTAASFFHGPFLVGGITFLGFVVLDSFKKIIKSLFYLRFNIQALVIVILAIVLIQAIVTNKIYIPKIGYFQDINFGMFSNELRARMIGDASYGQWASISRIDEMIYKLPLRVLYFLFSPFPWDIQKPTHLIGTFDGFLFFILFYFVFKNRKAILNDPFLIIAVIILLVYFISFAIGVSNFGAGIRHRSKFVMEIALLAGPLIPKIKFSKKN